MKSGTRAVFPLLLGAERVVFGANGPPVTVASTLVSAPGSYRRAAAAEPSVCSTPSRLAPNSTHRVNLASPAQGQAPGVLRAQRNPERLRGAILSARRHRTRASMSKHHRHDVSRLMVGTRSFHSVYPK